MYRPACAHRRASAVQDLRFPRISGVSLRSRVVQRARMRTLGLLGPQLARQHGLAGWLASPALNRLHREVITASVTALATTPGSTVADIGFGGGIGLRLLLRA